MSSEAALPALNLSAINDIDSRLAMELAIDISELPDILDRYFITPDELRKKLANKHFRAMVKDYRTMWGSDLSVKERIRIKSMMLVEDGLLDLHGIFKDHDIAPGARLDAFKTLTKVATVDVPDKDGAAAGERVHISINIPGVEKPVTYDAEVLTDGRETLPDSA